ncbi:hypothetical protein ABZS83_30025 [Streptomyces sp. NPDC005426]|uniref:hypothetical protein n=1 Tax=Streptomyces sp. NPDC005426 TaxID=3155344 RepID=UPI0033B37863
MPLRRLREHRARGRADRRPEVRTAADIDDTERRARALRTVALGLTAAGQANQARRAAANIGIGAKRARALSEVAQALATAGVGDQAALAAEEARQTATDAKNLSSPSASTDSDSSGKCKNKSLEMLLLTSNASEGLAEFPVPLLERLVLNNQL